MVSGMFEVFVDDARCCVLFLRLIQLNILRRTNFDLIVGADGCIRFSQTLNPHSRAFHR